MKALPYLSKMMFFVFITIFPILYCSCATVPPSPSAELCTEGYKAYRNRDWNRAILIYNQASELESSSNNLFPPAACPYQRPLAYARIGKFKEALADANFLVNNRPDDLDSFVTRCEVLSRYGNHKEAMDDCDTALRRVPNNSAFTGYKANAVSIKASVLVRSGKIDEGRKLFDEALSNNQYTQYILLRKAETFDEAGMNKDALLTYKAALSSDEDADKAEKGEKVLRAAAYGVLGYLSSANRSRFDDATVKFIHQRISELEKVK